MEIVEHCFSFLDLKSVLTASAVCKTWHLAARSNSIWRRLFAEHFRLDRCIAWPRVDTLNGDFWNPERQTFTSNELLSYEDAFKDWFQSRKYPFHEHLDPMIQARTQSVWTAIVPRYGDEAINRSQAIDRLSLVLAGDAVDSFLSLLMFAPSGFGYGGYSFYGHSVLMEFLAPGAPIKVV